eukprot:TRINITY_DN10558_c0_g1_i2.p1 TRINITY_DN10558_c0_g1~~TRINITY_DN10558_c0_g1_i2.p1  ORF type:complete len:1416 (+),score=296.73 TRINITY_DN10558_c0_g1_i2:126-4373(+)
MVAQTGVHGTGQSPLPTVLEVAPAAADVGVQDAVPMPAPSLTRMLSDAPAPASTSAKAASEAAGGSGGAVRQTTRSLRQPSTPLRTASKANQSHSPVMSPRSPPKAVSWRSQKAVGALEEAWMTSLIRADLVVEEADCAGKGLGGSSSARRTTSAQPARSTRSPPTSPMPALPFQPTPRQFDRQPLLVSIQEQAKAEPVRYGTSVRGRSARQLQTSVASSRAPSTEVTASESEDCGPESRSVSVSSNGSKMRFGQRKSEPDGATLARVWLSRQKHGFNRSPSCPGQYKKARAASAPPTANIQPNARGRSGSMQQQQQQTQQQAPLSTSSKQLRVPTVQVPRVGALAKRAASNINAAAGKENRQPSCSSTTSHDSAMTSVSTRMLSARARTSSQAQNLGLSEGVQARRSFEQRVMPCNRGLNRHARSLAVARGAAAKDAFQNALLDGVHRPHRTKLGFVGAARAGKTSTLRALAGLTLRPDEESTTGVAMWEVSKKLLSATSESWHLQESRCSSSSTGSSMAASRWDASLVQYVADRLRPLCTAAGNKALPGVGEEEDEIIEAEGGRKIDPAVMKKMPVDLIATSLSEGPAASSEDQSMVLETYDFAGQDVYYATHHLFITDYGLYLVCLDLSLVQAEVETGGLSRQGDLVGHEMEKEQQSWEALEWWLASIAINAPNSSVAIVGTHDDCLDAAGRAELHQRVNERVSALCLKLPELNALLHVNEVDQLCFFPIDNSKSDGGRSVETLQAAVASMAASLLSGPMGLPMPLRWAHFFSMLTTDDKLCPLCRTEELWKRALLYGFESSNELTNFLAHFRRLGSLLHFPEAQSEDLRDMVCLDPAWVADAAASILLAKDRVLQGCTRHAAELREKGLLHSDLLSAAWRPRGPKGFGRHQRQLVELLQALDLLLPWGHDRTPSTSALPNARGHVEAPQVYLVPSLLPVRPSRQPVEAKGESQEEDAIVLYLDFHGLLNRLLPTLFPRLLCALARSEASAQIITVYANYAVFSFSARGQAKSDSARSQGGRRRVPKLLVSLQPCAGGELLRCCLRQKITSGDGAATQSVRPSWRHVDRLLHALCDALASWKPHLSFKASVRCPLATCGVRPHSVDLHVLLRDEVPLCPRSCDLIEDLPSWLEEWRHHLQPCSPERDGGCCSHSEAEDAPRQQAAAAEAEQTQPASEEAPETSEEDQERQTCRVDYLYASPLDSAPLDIRAELEVIAGALPQVGGSTHIELAVRTATAEVFGEVWRAGRKRMRAICGDGDQAAGPRPRRPRVLCIAAHCMVEPSGAGLLLEDAVGRGHTVRGAEIAAMLAASGSPSTGSKSAAFDVAVVHACHSEALAEQLLVAGLPAELVQMALIGRGALIPSTWELSWCAAVGDASCRQLAEEARHHMTRLLETRCWLLSPTARQAEVWM